MLSPLLALHRDRFESLAQAWLAAGATAFEVWANGQALARWPLAPNGAVSTEPGRLTAPIVIDGQSVGELRVMADPALDGLRRLQAEADLIAHLGRLENELEAMTGELVESQDLLLALYDLTRSARVHLGTEETLKTLAQEAARLVKAASAFVVFAPLQGPLKVEQSPAHGLDDNTLFDLYRKAAELGRPLALNDNATNALPDGIETMYVIPIQIQGSMGACLGLLNRLGGAFSAPDLKLAQTVAEHAGVQLENLIFYDESVAQAKLQTEMELARRVQSSLLPHGHPSVQGLDFAAEAQAASQVGGDFYDVIDKAVRPFIFIVGDVSGKGMPAAMIMAMTRIALRNKAIFNPTPSPAVIMGRANEDLYDDFGEVGVFATVFIGQYDRAREEVTFANAGHSPVIYCAQGGPARLLEADGTALGVLPVSFCENQRLPLKPGDVLVVATDGFSEARNINGEMFGYERLLRLVESVADQPAIYIRDQLFQAVNDFSAGHPQDDDQTLIVIKGQAQ